MSALNRKIVYTASAPAAIGPYRLDNSKTPFPVFIAAGSRRFESVLGGRNRGDRHMFAYGRDFLPIELTCCSRCISLPL